MVPALWPFADPDIWDACPLGSQEVLSGVDFYIVTDPSSCEPSESCFCKQLYYLGNCTPHEATLSLQSRPGPVLLRQLSCRTCLEASQSRLPPRPRRGRPSSPRSTSRQRSACPQACCFPMTSKRALGSERAYFTQRYSTLPYPTLPSLCGGGFVCQIQAADALRFIKRCYTLYTQQELAAPTSCRRQPLPHRV